MPEQAKLIMESDFVPMYFTADVVVGPNIGDNGRGQVALNDRPFVLTRITHQIIMPPPVYQNVLEDQDGLYRIDWSLYEQSRFFKGTPPMADAAFGSIRDGRFRDLTAPVSLPGNQTLNVTVINERLRGDPITVHVEFQGVQKWGSLTQTGG